MSKTIVVTGCSSGFGELVAKDLAKKEHRVYATMRSIDDRNKSKALALRAFAQEHGVDLRVIELDVCSDESADAAAAVVKAESGAADVVINNAGQMYLGITECFSSDELTRQLNTNVVGVHRVSRAFLPGMRAQSSGLIINISSVAGRIALPFFGVYHASKWAIEGYTQAMRYELASSGVDAVVIEPGPFNTNLFGSTPTPSDQEGRSASYPDAVHQSFEGMKGGFDSMLASDEAPTDPQIVVDRMIELVEMTPGARPFRSVCGSDFGVREMNRQCEPFYDGVVGALGMEEFVQIKP